MVSCKIRGCKNRSDNRDKPKKLHFFSFPRDEEMAKKWLESCKMSVNMKYSRVCSAHFKQSCYKSKSEYLKELNYSRIGVRQLLPDAIPTENIAAEDTSKKTVSTDNSKCVVNRVNRKNRTRNNNKLKSTPKPQNKSTTNNNVTPVVFVHVLDNKQQPHIISSTPITTVKYVSGKANLDVRLERIEAPAHVLDHQYAVNSDSNSDSDLADRIKNSLKKNNNTNTSAVPKKRKLISRSSNRDQDTINQLKNQLQIKLMEQQKLKNQLKRLQSQIKNNVEKKVCDLLKNVFSHRQIDKLLNPHRTQIKWSVEDVLSAISLYNISSKAYSYLLENNYPLPGLSTIRKWTAGINVTEGILVDVLTLMKYKARSLSVFQKIVVLNFSEMYISDESYQVCIVRGLFYKWMQPIFYSYDQPLTDTTIKKIISMLYDIDYIVVAISLNFDLFNSQLWALLKIGVQFTHQCYFEHPSKKSYKIFVFPDEFHLLTQIRKHFMNNGLIVGDKLVHKKCIEEIININRELEGEEYHVLTEELLEDLDSAKDSVLLVKRLFSKTTAQEISYYGQEGFLFYKDWEEVANFFKLFSEWIDLFDSKVKEGYEEGEEPYGLFLEKQNDILNKVQKLMLSTQVQDFKSFPTFQEQVSLRSISLQQLLNYLQESYSIEDFQITYILTNRLSNECLDNLMVYLSGNDEEIENSSISQFQRRLRKSILGKYSCDSALSQILKITDPCLIDFHERSDSVTNTKKEKQQQSGYATETAEKMRKFLIDNNISTQKVHKNLLHMLNKNT